MVLRVIEIDGVKYATGLQWESFNYDGSTRLDMEINNLSRNTGKEWGCRILHTNDKKQVGFASKDLKGYVALGAILARRIKDALYIKRISDDEFYICFLDEKGLIQSSFEGIVDSTEFIKSLQLISNANSDLNIVISNEDHELIFDDEDNYNYNIKSFDEIIQNYRKTTDDVIDKVVYENKKAKYIASGVAVLILAGAGYLVFSKPKTEYDEIINHEIASSLDKKVDILKKFMANERPNIERNTYINQGKIVLKNKVETSIYSKQEIIQAIQSIFDNYPPVLNEWQFTQIRFDKMKNDSDIKFSIVLVRIKDSFGYYTEAENVIKELSKKLPLFDIKIFPADTSNNIIVADLYFKQKKEVISENEFKDKITKLNTEQNQILSDSQAALSTISEKEADVEQNTNFFQKRFGSHLEEIAEEIGSTVNTQTRKIDNFIKRYNEIKTYNVDVPYSYSEGNRLELLNLSQKTSFYNWSINSTGIPMPEKDQNDKSENYDYYARSYEFTINPDDINTKGFAGLYNVISIIDKPYYNIYGIQYDINNEQWSIKGEMYEKK